MSNTQQSPDPIEDDDYDEPEFIPCDKCDGHPACEDFGCAFELGLGKMVKNILPDDMIGMKNIKYDT